MSLAGFSQCVMSRAERSDCIIFVIRTIPAKVYVATFFAALTMVKVIILVRNCDVRTTKGCAALEA